MGPGPSNQASADGEAHRAEALNFTFVHVPKNGGTAFEVWIRYHAKTGCPRVTGFGHENTIVTAERNGKVAIVILREPFARLLSAFNFWKYGVKFASKLARGKSRT